MSEKQIKAAYDLAQNEIEKAKNEKINALVKKIVQESLEKIDKLDEEIKHLQEKKKVLKQTLDDLKEGKLDLLKERIEKDPEVLKVIPIRIHVTEIRPVEIVNVPYVPSNPWHTPWTVWYGDNLDAFSVNCSTAVVGKANSGMTGVGTTSQISNAVGGTYCLNSGRTVTLR